jgi:KUP system potassium uptake protein
VTRPQELVSISFQKKKKLIQLFLPRSGGTFALYTLISRHAKVSLIPNQQAEDELVSKYNRGKPPATLRRAQWMKELLETNKAVKVSLFLLTMLATAMVISDAILTPAISGTI